MKSYLNNASIREDLAKCITIKFETPLYATQIDMHEFARGIAVTMYKVPNRSEHLETDGGPMLTNSHEERSVLHIQ